MKHFIYTILLSLFFVNSSALASEPSEWYPPKSPDDFDLASEQMAKRGVVKIVSEWQEGEVEVGAGMMLGYEESSLFFITASHVVYNSEIGTADEIVVSFLNDRVIKYQASVYRYDVSSDVAVIILKNFYEKKHLEKIVKFPLDLEFNYLQRTKVKTLGHPYGKEWYISVGETKPINHPTQMGLHPDLTQDGNSGGPVLSQQNRLIGMVIEGEGQQQGYAIKINAILRILDDWNIPYRARIVGKITENIQYIQQAIWDHDWDRLKGEQLPDKYNFKLWQAKYSFVDNSKARVFMSKLYKNRISYVVFLGRYGSAATLEEAWRLWVRELHAAINKTPKLKEKPFLVKEKGKHHIHFYRYYRKSRIFWLGDPKLSIEIFEDYGSIYIVLYSFDGSVMPSLSGWTISDFFEE